MSKLSLKDFEMVGKKVLMRVDFNVPQDANGTITDDTRIKASLPSIKYILEHGGRLILMSHLGKPNGKNDPKYSLAPIAKRLGELLHKPVLMCKECTGQEVSVQANALKNGDLMLLENLRFHEAEEHPEKDPAFAKNLSLLGDSFVNDAFGTAHRAHSSTTLVPTYFPEKSAAGFLMEKEIAYLGDNLSHPKKPFIAVIGGSKVSSKLGVIKSLLKKADAILIGGGMAYTFLKAQGFSIGNSICEDDLLKQAKDILKTDRNKIFLPVDHLISNDLTGAKEIKVCDVNQGIPSGFYGVDIGPKTIKLFQEKLKSASTVLWNGPLGIFEVVPFSKGTIAIAKTISSLDATTIVGGGDSIAALAMAGVTDKISHVSTGGGASLEYLEFGSLPGIDALTEKIKK